MTRLKWGPFGKIPDKKHILVAQATLTHFPTPKIVPLNAAQPVISALNNIYTDQSIPQNQHTNNGPPINSAAFQEFPNTLGITHNTIYPHHPQDNNNNNVYFNAIIPAGWG